MKTTIIIECDKLRYNVSVQIEGDIMLSKRFSRIPDTKLFTDMIRNATIRWRQKKQNPAAASKQ